MWQGEHHLKVTFFFPASSLILSSVLFLSGNGEDRSRSLKQEESSPREAEQKQIEIVDAHPELKEILNNEVHSSVYCPLEFLF